MHRKMTSFSYKSIKLTTADLIHHSEEVNPKSYLGLPPEKPLMHSSFLFFFLLSIVVMLVSYSFEDIFR
jgi:hypothetical protein